ncbi:MAG: amino acid adenylation domain-containing protein [Planctomycetota bacterium]
MSKDAVRDRIDEFITASAQLNGQAIHERTHWNSVVTVDAIRHFAYGIGDDNPLWLDPDYAAESRYGRLVAPPAFLASVLYPIAHGAPIDVRLSSLVSGVEYRWSRPILLNEKLRASINQVAVQEGRSRDGRRLVFIISETTYWNEAGQVVGKAAGTTVRAAQQGGDLLVDRPIHRYRDEELAEIVEALRAETRTGRRLLTQEDTKVGRTLPTLVRGPLTIGDLVCWQAAVGPAYRAGGLGYADCLEAPHAAVRNPITGWLVGDSQQHEDFHLSSQRGIPAPFDYGVMRFALVSSLLTNWMGDDGFLKRLSARIEAPVLYGDTNRYTGTIAKKVGCDEGTLVTVRITGVNQEGATTTTGEAEVLLPLVTPVEPVLTDRRPSILTSPPEDARSFEAQSFMLPAATAEALGLHSRDSGVSPVAVLQAAVMSVLFRNTVTAEGQAVRLNVSVRQTQAKQVQEAPPDVAAFRVDLSANTTFAQLMGQVEDRIPKSIVQGALLCERPCADSQDERTSDGPPACRLILQPISFAGESTGTERPDAYAAGPDNAIVERDLTFGLWKEEGDSCLLVEWGEDRADEETACRMQAALQTLLARGLSDPDTRLSDLPLLTESQRRQLLVEWNDTDVDYPRDRCVHRLFQEQVARTPDKIAVGFEDQQLTYRELNHRANQLARYLQRRGVGPGHLVGVCTERSIDTVVAILGILKAGGCYVPLDASYPPKRLSLMLEDVGVSTILVQEPLLKKLPATRARTVLIDADRDAIAAESEEEVSCGVTADSPAYVLYTSGSTGTPKATAVAHRSLCLYIQSARSSLGVHVDDVYLHSASFSFSASVRQWTLPLCTGCTLVIASSEQRQDPIALLELIKKRDVTVWDVVTSFWRHSTNTLAQQDEEVKGDLLSNKLRHIFVTGGTLTWDVVHKWRYELGHPARVVNLYSLTEAAGTVAVYPVPTDFKEKAGVVPIGGPIENTRLYVLDAYLQPVPLGVRGELCVGGDRLAAGYLNDAALTAERYIQNPFPETADSRIFRTGDIVRYRPDGTVVCLGRADNRVRVRGFRIEPGEIEAALAEHPSTQEGVVTARQDPSGDDRLVAYVVSNVRPAPTAGQLRDFLRERLPDFMVPSAFVFLDAMPLTSNGKVDRKALPAPDLGRPELGVPFIAPRTPLEESLAEILADILGVDSVGVNDNFFALGGHSLLATQVVSRLNDAFHVKLSLRTLLESPTVAGLAVAISERAAHRPDSEDSLALLPEIAPDPEARYQPFPLTDVQQAYWIGRSGLFELGNVSTHRYMELESGDLDLDCFNRAWQRLIDRHDMLRAVILPDGRQQVLKEVPPYKIEVVDLRGQDPQAVESQLSAIRQRMSHQVLPSDRWPLFEIRASRLDEGRLRLHCSFDALILGLRSRLLLFEELARLYRYPDTSLRPLELTFRDYVLAEVSLRDTQLYRRSRDYWWGRIADLPPAPDLPLAREPGTLTHPKFTRYSARLDRLTWLRLKKRVRQAGLTPSGFLLAAFVETLKVWSKRPRFTINLTLFNRLPLHPQVNDIVGDFTSLSLLEVDDSAQGSFEARAKRLQQQLWEDMEHRYVSGVQVLRELAKRQGGTPRAAMPVVFTSGIVHEADETAQDPTRWIGDLVYDITQTPQVWIDHQVFENAGVLVFNWDIVEGLFPDGFLQGMFDGYCGLLRRLAREEDAWREGRADTARSLVPAAELEQRAAVNATRAPTPEGMLHTLFAEQVHKRPDHPAVVDAKASLTYAQLYRVSNQVARRLRELGARPNSLVAVLMEKGWEQAAAVLGILVSGAAYLPIDAELPDERRAFLLEHGEVELVVTQSWLDQRLAWPDGVRRVCVDNGDLRGLDDRPLEPIQGADDLAYVIYTSGSTGVPKGVMIDHRGAVNTIADINRRFRVGPEDRVLALSSLSFDLSVYDIFGTLAGGGTIILPEPAGARDPAHWAELIARQNVTIWNSVPTLMKLLVEYLGRRPDLRPRSLRLALLSGDWIPMSLPEQIKRLNDEVRVISLGGATEASIWSILYPIEEVDPSWKSIPYGKPMDNQQFHVLNEALAPCPVWVHGQLYIGGVGLAKGYWRDEEKTRTSFVTHPLTGERLYRTGDMGRYLPDSDIEFLGREDFQVKIQGYRVELGEIETALARHEGIRAAVLRAIGEPQGEKRLVAYVVPEQETVPSTEELRRFLEETLPEYMVPSVFVPLKALPLTPNGKVDRAALPEPSTKRVETAEPPQAEATDLSARIGGWVEDILGVGRIDPQANLLYLGATSIDMIRIVNRLESELGFRPRIDDFYRRPTVLGLVEAYRSQRPDRRPQEKKAAAALSLPESVLASYELLTDPADRDAFKSTRPGLRRGDDDCLSIQLVGTVSGESLEERRVDRRSHRRFVARPVTLAQLSDLLSCLRETSLDGKPKYSYASAGGLYPVQTYLYVKRGRVEGLSAGVYYHHPKEHRLVLLAADADVDRRIYDPLVNAPIFDEAAFALFLIARLGAIAPMYGARSLHYATIEAGLMAQQLETAAPACGTGLCQIGNVDFQAIRHHFALDEDHVLVHSLLGGPVDPGDDGDWVPFHESHSRMPADTEDREEGEV